MFLMAQLKIRNDSIETAGPRFERFICTFACPKEECFGQLVFEKGFSSEGGSGVFKCIEKRVLVVSNENKAKKNIPIAPNKSSWYDNKDVGNDDDDWGMGYDDDDDDVNLENAVAAMESKLDEGGALVMPPKKAANKPATIPASSSSKSLLNAFGCYLLKKQNEPRSTKFLEDEDDVGLSESDEKIRNMLARYMAEEEDEDILAVLGGGNIAGSGNGTVEEDERLSEEDRILRGFQDRQRRAPRQVIRYAYGGKPFWSIPDQNLKSGKVLWSVPNCSYCGEERKFEMQVLPSILDALEVDKCQTESKTKTKDGSVALDDLLSNGLNFGSIAVFTCSNTSCRVEERAASLVIQKSVDDLPEKGNSNSFCGDNFSTPTMAVVEDLYDDAEFKLDV